MADKSNMAHYNLKMKKAIAFLIAFLLLALNFMPAAHADNRDDEYSNVLYKAWANYLSYSNPSTTIKIKIHASGDIPKSSVDAFSDGARWTLNKYGAIFSDSDIFHLIFASNYADAQGLMTEVNAELPDYSTYNTRHLSIAKTYFDKPDDSTPAGGTSSRGCNYEGSPYGNFQGVIKPCPTLYGGAIYAFGTTKSFENNYSNLFTIGAHEAFHLVLTKMNPYSHYIVPEWIIEGVCQSVGLTATSTDTNLLQKSSMLNPSPALDPNSQRTPYDLTQLETQGKPERFAIGILASDLLLSRSDAQTFFKFLTAMNNPNSWESEFEKYFGMSKSAFYENFKDFHSWYYSKGIQIIRERKFAPLLGITPTPTASPTPTPAASPTPAPTASPTPTPTAKKVLTILCIKGRTIKKVISTNPKCPKGYKKK